jgi:hypothetical protein
MSFRSSVRASRDGDQFHYLWAARRCLHLLAPTPGLVAITIEGASPSEGLAAGPLEEGEELIDVAEYYGSEEWAHATAIRYVQLKHSTVRATDPWTWSGLEKTLAGFGSRYKALQQRPEAGTAAFSKLTFWFISNRPIGSNERETIDDAANGAPARHPTDLAKLETITALKGPNLSEFCKLLRFEGGREAYWEQRNILTQEMGGYLPDADFDAPTQLKELVTRKASSEGKANPTITKIDVLRVLKTDEGRLFPAPCLIEHVGGLVPREQETEIIGHIVTANHVPVIIHAAGGVGKSVLSTRIHLGLPLGSACILYDCFGKGQYRSASTYRHRHKDALVQIANELAGKALCHPLIPTPHADSSAYSRAFLHRLAQSVASLKAESADALLCVVIDAADNAQIAAEEIGEVRSFARDLLREQIPDGVRIVALCRTHRQHLLDAPPSSIRCELRPFSRVETATHLRHGFPNATERDIDEFHRLSSQNPRVQVMAMSRKASLDEILRDLGPNPTTVEDAIGNLLDKAIAKIRDEAGIQERSQIDRICGGLAVLRPLIPISVLAEMSRVDESAVRSFAFDLGRPLLVTGDSVQFFDEPAETWFRDRFRPKAAGLKAFVESLRPLSSKSAYVAAALPQLMLEAGRLTELIELALSSEGLPDHSPVERRDVELQRLQFALKASLRAKRYTDAAKLALKAGGESAGDERQWKLLQANTDLAAVLLEPGQIQEAVSRGMPGSGWRGSHFAYDAGILSGRGEFLGDARSRLRMAEEWLRNWSRLSDEEREQENVSNQDIAEMALAHFNIHGARHCARFLRRWKPRWISFRAGSILVSRLADHCRFGDLDDLAVAARNDLYLVLAILLELRRVQRSPAAQVVERALRLAVSARVVIRDPDRLDTGETVLQAIIALAEAAHHLSVCGHTQLSELLTRYLPRSPRRGDYSRFTGSGFVLLRGFSLRAALAEKPLELMDLAHPELKTKLEQSHQDSQDAREFREDVGALLPWHRLWADTFIGRIPKDGLAPRIAEAEKASSSALRSTYREGAHTPNEIARVWFEVLIEGGSNDTRSLDRFDEWVQSLGRPLFTTTRTRIARIAARTKSLQSLALTYANLAFQITRDEREDAETKASAYIGLARAIFPASHSDAAAYFDAAVAVASKVGDENLDRWGAMLDLADRVADANSPNAEAAYKLARCAEVTYAYVDRDKHFDWESTVSAIAGLCPCSSLAILSRWRDRDFGWAERLLPIVINRLVERGNLDPMDALALVGFRAHWDEVRLLRAALRAYVSKSDKENAAAFVHRYMVLTGKNSRTWQSLKELLDLHRIVIPGLEELISFGDQPLRSNRLEHEHDGGASHSTGENQWTYVFADLDLETPEGVSQAFRRFKGLEPPWHHERFFAEACTRVKVGNESSFVTAIADVPELNLYHFQGFFDQVPQEWRGRLSIKAALGTTVKRICQRFCLRISGSGYYESLPLRKVSEVSGLSESEIIDCVLSALGENAEAFRAGRLFTMIGLLATKLSHGEALQALTFGFDVFESFTEVTDGDGPWSAALAPPSDIGAAIGGYVWAGLAAPKGSLRWEAAHVVRALCTLRREKVLGHVVELARAPKCGPFADARLHFYDMHALQWLLIAIARAAKENPDILFPDADFLIQLAQEGEPHVLIKGFAANAALTLVESGLPGHRQPDLRERLAAVNVSPFKVVESSRYGRIEPQEVKANEQERRPLHLGFDFGQYWLRPLGDCFAQSQRDVELAVSDLITRDWQWPSKDGWIQDERARRHIFKEGETYDSHGSNPQAHDLQFYLSYHAMMTVAGRLLASVPVHRDLEFAEYDFQGWLARHRLTRTDGNWVADRRDPAPLERAKWKDNREADNWRWSICRSDFDDLLILPSGRLNLWGYWMVFEDSKEQSVAIRSALVSSLRSESLLRALQCCSPYDYAIPALGDDEIDKGDFQLRAWIANSQWSSRLDEQDPWAGNIVYPPLAPADFVQNLLGLHSDPEQRHWRMAAIERDPIALWCQIWGQSRERNDEEEPENGRRLQGSFEFVREFLRRVGMDLIIKVEIRRRLRHSRYHRDSSDDFEYILPSARLFLAKSDGSIRAI